MHLLSNFDLFIFHVTERGCWAGHISGKTCWLSDCCQNPQQTCMYKSPGIDILTTKCNAFTPFLIKVISCFIAKALLKKVCHTSDLHRLITCYLVVRFLLQNRWSCTHLPYFLLFLLVTHVLVFYKISMKRLWRRILC